MEGAGKGKGNNEKETARQKKTAVWRVRKVATERTCQEEEGGKQSASQKVEHRIALWPSNSTRYIIKQIKSRDSDRGLYSSIHSHILHNGPKVVVRGNKCPSTGNWIMWGVRAQGSIYHLAIKRSELLILQHAWTWKTLCKMKSAFRKDNNVWFHSWAREVKSTDTEQNAG